MDIDYHPASDFHQFNESQYRDLLEKLADEKTGVHFMVEKGTLTVASLTTRIWQKIKGWFGFEDKTNIIKVNYELLKLIRYGKNQHFFEKKEFEDLIQRLTKKFEPVSDYRPVWILLNKLKEDPETPAVEKEIRIYYHQHQDELHKSFWHRLFQAYVPPVEQTALYQFNLGKIYFEEGQIEEAILSLKKSLSLNPAHLESHHLLGKSLFISAKQKLEKGEVNDALSLINEAIKSERDNATYKDLLGKIYWMKEEREKALPYLSETSREQLAKQHYESGLEEEEYGHIPVAIQQYALALKLQPSHNQSFIKITLLQGKKEDINQWIEDLKKIIQQSPDEKEAHLQIALVYFEKRDYQTAKKHFERTLTLDPLNSQVLYALGNIYLLEKQYKKAIDYFVEAGKSQNDPFKHYSELKEVLPLWINEDFKTAQPYLEEALPVANSKESQILLHQLLSQVYVKVGSFDKAIEALKQVGQLEGNTKKYEQAILEIYLEKGNDSYRQLIAHPTLVRQNILDLVNEVVTSEEYPAIVKALGWIKRERTRDNRDLLQLGVNAKTLEEVLHEGERAIELIKKAYNGGWHHMRPNQMPPLFTQKLEILKQRLEDMVQFYEGEGKHKDLDSLGNTALESYFLVYKQKPNEFGKYLNNIIDIYCLRKEFKKGIEFYDGCHLNHPSWPIEINPSILSEEGQKLLTLPSEEAHSLILQKKAIELAPYNTLFKERLSHAYYLIGNRYQQKGDFHTAYDFYLKALDCGVDAEGACYHVLASIEEMNYYDKQKNGSFSFGEKNEMIQKIIHWQKKAIEREPNNSMYYFRYARFGFHELGNQGFDFMTPLKKAVDLDENNVLYISSLVQGHKKLTQIAQEKAKGGEFVDVQAVFKAGANDRDKLERLTGDYASHPLWQPGAPIL